MAMEEKREYDIAYMHMILGALAGVASATSKNIGFSIGLLFAYSGYFLVLILFKPKREDFNFNTWLAKGLGNFLITWLPIWIFLYNVG